MTTTPTPKCTESQNHVLVALGPIIEPVRHGAAGGAQLDLHTRGAQ